MFKHFRKLPVALVVLLGCLGSNMSYAALVTSGSVYMYSEPGNYVGDQLGSREVTWIHGIDGTFSSNSQSSKEALINFSNGWSFYFATYRDPALKVGHYPNARPDPSLFPSHAGLIVSGAVSGNKGSTGSFKVLDVAFDSTGSLERLAVDFVQYSGTNFFVGVGPGLYGSLRYNSSIPINTVPLPASALLLFSGLISFAGLAKVRRRREVTKRVDSAGAPS